MAASKGVMGWLRNTQVWNSIFRHGPPDTPRNRALTLGLSCSPCINAWNLRVSPCTDNQCMQQMEASWVAEAALAQIDAVGG